MDTILWQDSFSVGDEIMDNQHKKMIKMLNVMIDNKDKSAETGLLWDMVNEMTQYAENHFRDEEDYMAQIGFDDLENHKLEHDGFRERVSEFSLELFIESETIQEEILVFLCKWLVEHILESDMQYSTNLAVHISAKGQSATQQPTDTARMASS